MLTVAAALHRPTRASAGLAWVTSLLVAAPHFGWELRFDLYPRGESLAQVAAHQAGCVDLGLPLVSGIVAATVVGLVVLTRALQRRLGAAAGAALGLTVLVAPVLLGPGLLPMMLPAALLAVAAGSGGRARALALTLAVVCGEALAPGVGVGLAALGGVAATQALGVVGALFAVSRLPWPDGRARAAVAGAWGAAMLGLSATGWSAVALHAPGAALRVDLGPVVTLAALDGPVLHLPDAPLSSMNPSPTNPAVRVLSWRAGATAALPDSSMGAAPDALLAEPLVALSWNLADDLPAPVWALPPGAPGEAAAALGVHWVMVHRAWLDPSALALLDPLLRRHLGLPQRDLANGIDLYRLTAGDTKPPAPVVATRAAGALPDGWQTQADALAAWSVAKR